ncbi:hypothetical protein [uncultured Pontibacter sp.]|uniref:hypothetical protein n=1 Tax=uncultured Pontibacter sp. TaxID=453356 RepID=UPI00261FD020|nr:hypothetical protein [uncultured Pontibacter sp.]
MQHKFMHFRNSLGRRYCTLRHRRMYNLIGVSWKGTAPEESIKDVKASILQMVKHHNCNAILNDVQDFYSAPTEILAELTKIEWDEEAYNAGVQYLAHVLKPDSDSPLAEDVTVKGLEIKFFTTKLDALDWLKSKLKVN